MQYQSQILMLVERFPLSLDGHSLHFRVLGPHLGTSTSPTSDC